MESRPLSRVPVPPGVEGARRLLPALAAALSGDGPAIAPVPTVSSTCSQDYVASILAAVRPDGPPLESDDVAAVIPTSGSTGNPHGVLLSASALTSATPAINGPDAQWILALPVTSIGGINVLTRSLASGRPPVIMPSIGGAGPFTSAGFAAAVAEAGGSTAEIHVSLVPAQIARLLADDIGARALAQCRRVLVGGSTLRPSLHDLAEREGITLTTTYGATETAGGCILDGEPLPGVVVTIEDGTLVLDGPCLASGYRGEPELTRQTFGATGFRTHDVGVIEPDGRVRVIGRSDDVVVINGVNVGLGAVEQVVADHPDIAAAAVVTTRGDDREPRLHGFIVVRDRAANAAESATQSVIDRLGAAARPHLHEVADLPYLPHGKVDRRLLMTRAREIDEER